jgi:pyridoxal 5'-phosphate synthase pdxT subunit
MRIGVLAVQGAFREHASVLRGLGVDVVEVRKPEQLDGLDGLVIPGGESTAIGRLIRLYGLEEAIRRFAAPVFGTCAGMILLDRNHLGLVDLDVERNAYGRQVASFEADLDLAGESEPVLLRDGRFLVASFHPELTGDPRVHERFLELVREEVEARVGS